MWNRISDIGVAAIQKFGPNWLKKFTMGKNTNSCVSPKKSSILEKLGEKVGLNNSEVLAVIPSNSALQLQAGSSCLTWCFSCFGFLILLFIGAIFMTIYPGSDITTTTTSIITTTGPTTYIPGTYYGTITPQDFKKRRYINATHIFR